MRASIGAGTGAQKRLAQVGVEATVIGFVGGQPFGQEGVQAHAAGLEGGKPDGLHDREQRSGVIGLGPAQAQAGRPGRGRFGAQGADGGLAMVAEEGDGLIEELAFVNRAGSSVGPSQSGQHFGFRWLTHVGMHIG